MLEPVESGVTISDSMNADEKEQLSYGLREFLHGDQAKGFGTESADDGHRGNRC